MRELILGAGNRSAKILYQESPYFDVPFRVDIDPRCEPDLLWDLNKHPLPIDDESFDEIHAYEVLEHLGRQGDWRGFFEEFSDYHRVLKPGGVLFATTPSLTSPWLWGDPGHTRAISQETLVFLDQQEYVRQVGQTPMTDYRAVYSADFELIHAKVRGELFYWGLKKR